MRNITNPYLINTGTTSKYCEFQILHKSQYAPGMRTTIGLWVSRFTGNYEESIFIKGTTLLKTMNDFRNWWNEITIILGVLTAGWVFKPNRKDYHMRRHLDNPQSPPLLSWYVRAHAISKYKPSFEMEDMMAQTLYCIISRPIEELSEEQKQLLQIAIDEKAIEFGFTHPESFEQRSYSPTGEPFTTWTHKSKGNRFLLKELRSRDV